MGHSQPPAESRAEFDAYAAGYSAGMDNPLKRMIGSDADQFVALKVEWLLRDLRKRPLRSAESGRPPSLLDYGCGAGTLMQLLARSGFPGQLSGCDISTGMLLEARGRWEGPGTPTFEPQQGAATPFPDGSFEVIVISAVLHHVPVAERPAVYCELSRVLRPGGRLYVFEHNPLNPVTRFVVAHTPIDANAILLYSREVTRGVRAAGLTAPRTRYLMYFPPGWKKLRPVERALGGWLPLGGQYVVVVDKPFA